MSAAPVADASSLVESLRRIVGDVHVRDDLPTLTLYSQDIYTHAPHQAAVVVSPASTEELAAAVRAATRAGRAVIPRGAGMSYTSGYLADEAGAVLLDMTRMNRILEINEDDRYVRVEAGCTWAALYEALRPRGLRTPFWGPLSGIVSTVGGGLSQGNAFFGAGAYGSTADSLLALRVVLADGAIIDTGSASTVNGAPFFRHYGPDVAGLFTGDCGALGVKAEATLRLIPAPRAEGYASFAFGTPEASAAAMSAMARDGVGAELFGFDPDLQRVRLRRASLAADVKSLAAVVRNSKSILSGVREAARIAVAGRDFVDDAEYSVHIVCEGRSEAAVAADLALARAHAAAAGGREIENTIPKVVRANPFTPLNNVVGPEGERWAPVHGIVPHSKAAAVWRAIAEDFRAQAEAFEGANVTSGFLTTTLSTAAFLIEPVFYWHSAMGDLHRATVEPATLARLRGFPNNAAADAVVAEARRRVCAIFLEHGAAHFQIGRTYPYKEGRKPEAWRLLSALKAAVDPGRRMNPGALGL